MEGGTAARTPYTPEQFDEAIGADGALRGPYAELLPALEALDLEKAAAGLRDHLSEQGVDFKGDEGPQEFSLDLAPRLLSASEWEELEAGLRQRFSHEQLVVHRGRSYRRGPARSNSLGRLAPSTRAAALG
jgi:uncharacterized circularly permuted ATP-grasp superfamily protein